MQPAKARLIKKGMCMLLFRLPDGLEQCSPHFDAWKELSSMEELSSIRLACMQLPDVEIRLHCLSLQETLSARCTYIPELSRN